MKTPILVRVAALIASAATTFALVEALALYALPAPDAATRIAQATAPAPR
jgi:hypothetical protein